MADITALKKSGKDAPPPERRKAPGNTQRPAREKKAANKPVQFQIPEDVLEAFSREAAEVFGYRHGSKSQMFLRLWENYKNPK